MPKLFLSIREASEAIGEKPHVLRFWERNIPALQPVRRAGGRRYYREDDLQLLRGIQSLIREEGMTLRGVNRVLRQHGAAIAREPAADREADNPARRLREAAATLRASARELRGGAAAGSGPEAG